MNIILLKTNLLGKYIVDLSSAVAQGQEGPPLPTVRTLSWCNGFKLMLTEVFMTSL